MLLTLKYLLLVNIPIWIGLTILLFYRYQFAINILDEWESLSVVSIQKIEAQRLHNFALCNKIITEHLFSSLSQDMQILTLFFEQELATPDTTHQTDLQICSSNLFKQSACPADFNTVYKKNTILAELWYHTKTSTYQDLKSVEQRFLDKNLNKMFLAKSIYKTKKKEYLSIEWIFHTLDTSLMVATPAIIPGTNAQGGGFCENGYANGTNPVYDPRCRKWYISALTSQGQKYTTPYKFAINKIVGITLTKLLKTEATSVFSINFGLNNLGSQLFSTQDDLNEKSDYEGYTVLFHQENLTVFHHKYWSSKSYTLSSWADLEYNSTTTFQVDDFAQFKKNVQNVIDYSLTSNYSIESYQNVEPFFFRFKRNNRTYSSVTYPIKVRLAQENKYNSITKEQIVLYITRVHYDISEIIKEAMLAGKFVFILLSLIEGIFVVILIIVSFLHYAAIFAHRLDFQIDILIEYLRQQEKSANSYHHPRNLQNPLLNYSVRITSNSQQIDRSLDARRQSVLNRALTFSSIGSNKGIGQAVNLDSLRCKTDSFNLTPVIATEKKCENSQTNNTQLAGFWERIKFFLKLSQNINKTPPLGKVSQFHPKIQNTSQTHEKQQINHIKLKLNKIDRQFMEVSILIESFEQLESVVTMVLRNDRSDNSSSLVEKIILTSSAKKFFKLIKNTYGAGMCSFRIALLLMEDRQFFEAIEHFESALFVMLIEINVKTVEDLQAQLKSGILNYNIKNMQELQRRLYFYAICLKEVACESIGESRMRKQREQRESENIEEKKQQQEKKEWREYFQQKSKLQPKLIKGLQKQKKDCNKKREINEDQQQKQLLGPNKAILQTIQDQINFKKGKPPADAKYQLKSKTIESSNQSLFIHRGNHQLSENLVTPRNQISGHKFSQVKPQIKSSNKLLQYHSNLKSSLNQFQHEETSNPVLISYSNYLSQITHKKHPDIENNYRKTDDKLKSIEKNHLDSFQEPQVTLESTEEQSIYIEESESEINNFETALLKKSLRYLQIIMKLIKHSLNRFEAGFKEVEEEETEETGGVYHLQQNSMKILLLCELAEVNTMLGNTEDSSLALSQAEQILTYFQEEDAVFSAEIIEFFESKVNYIFGMICIQQNLHYLGCEWLTRSLEGALIIEPVIAQRTQKIIQKTLINFDLNNENTQFFSNYSDQTKSFKESIDILLVLEASQFLSPYDYAVQKNVCEWIHSNFLQPKDRLFFAIYRGGQLAQFFQAKEALNQKYFSFCLQQLDQEYEKVKQIDVYLEYPFLLVEVTNTSLEAYLKVSYCFTGRQCVQIIFSFFGEIIEPQFNLEQENLRTSNLVKTIVLNAGNPYQGHINISNIPGDCINSTQSQFIDNIEKKHIRSKYQLGESSFFPHSSFNLHSINNTKGAYLNQNCNSTFLANYKTMTSSTHLKYNFPFPLIPRNGFNAEQMGNTSTITKNFSHSFQQQQLYQKSTKFCKASTFREDILYEADAVLENSVSELPRVHSKSQGEGNLLRKKALQNVLSTLPQRFNNQKSLICVPQNSLLENGHPEQSIIEQAHSGTFESKNIPFHTPEFLSQEKIQENNSDDNHSESNETSSLETSSISQDSQDSDFYIDEINDDCEISEQDNLNNKVQSSKLGKVQENDEKVINCRNLFRIALKQQKRLHDHFDEAKQQQLLQMNVCLVKDNNLNQFSPKKIKNLKIFGSFTLFKHYLLKQRGQHASSYFQLISLLFK